MNFSLRRAPKRRWSLNHPIALIMVLLAMIPGLAMAQSPWTRTFNSPPFGISTCTLLTDGTVICDNGGAFNGGTGQFCMLTPDSTGSYANGSWTVMPSLPDGYGPLYYASGVLADGRFVIIGGEYNLGGFAFTNLGAIYNPVQGTWANLLGPPSWDAIGDAMSCILPDGRFMLQNPLNSETSIMNPKTLTWTTPGVFGKNDDNDEEGWTLLPNGKILTVDVNNLNSELYDPLANGGLGKWSLAGVVPVQLPDIGTDLEMGPQVLRPDGTVICFGATGHNAVYNSLTGVWTKAPDFPMLNGQPLDCADAPACILANGNVLVCTSPGLFNPPTRFFVWNGATLTPVPNTANAANNTSFFYRMLVLPTGEVMVTDGTDDVEIYTAGNTPQNAWRPTITSAPTLVNAGQTYTVSGTQFNGLTQGAQYGDDAQSATNYPLVRFTSHLDGSVTYQRTHNHSTMGVATGGKPVSTSFDVSPDLSNGTYDLQVVANGIASNHTTLTLQGGNLLVNPRFELGPKFGWTASPYVISSDTFEPSRSGSWKAWLGGYAKAHTDSLYQTVTLPASVTTISLSFWVHIDSMDGSGSPHDRMALQIRDGSGVLKQTLAVYSNSNAAIGFLKKTFNLTPYKGQTIQIYFIEVDDSNFQTDFVLDDFTLVAH